jgi:hypothetical protein
MTARTLRILGLGLALVATSCKEGPVAGELAAELATPNADDGAIQFTLTATTGTTISQLSQTCSGCKLFVVKVNDNQYKGVVTGNLGAGTLFRLTVSDRTKPSSYSVLINAVSNRTFAVRNTLTGYSVTLR